MTDVSTYTFAGDIVTFLGLFGIIGTFVILVTVFNRFQNSNLNK